jgi:hypothetical protein
MPFVALFPMACGQRVDRAAWWTIVRQFAIASTVLDDHPAHRLVRDDAGGDGRAVLGR